MKTNRTKKILCATPAPLLWKGLFYFIPLLTIAFIVLFSQALIRMYANKKSNKHIFDKSTKKLTLWSLVVFLSLISYGIIGLDFNFYLLEFFLLTVFVLGAFFAGERLKLFVTKKSLWIFVATLSLLFAIFFTICFTASIKDQAAFDSGVQSSCINRYLF